MIHDILIWMKLIKKQTQKHHHDDDDCDCDYDWDQDWDYVLPYVVFEWVKLLLKKMIHEVIVITLHEDCPAALLCRPRWNGLPFRTDPAFETGPPSLPQGFPRYPYPNDDTFPGWSGRVEKKAPTKHLGFLFLKIISNPNVSLKVFVTIPRYPRYPKYLGNKMWRNPFSQMSHKFYPYPRDNTGCLKCIASFKIPVKPGGITHRFITFHNLSAVSSYVS